MIIVQGKRYLLLQEFRQAEIAIEQQFRDLSLSSLSNSLKGMQLQYRAQGNLITLSFL